jgi:NDP-hexose 4-ketoreductase
MIRRARYNRSVIVLLGASGFIGRHVEATLREQAEVVAVPRGEDVGEALRQLAPKAVVNCAGATRGEPAALVRANVVLVARLLAALKPGTRLVQLGTAAEYGRVPMGPAVAEDTPCRPVGDYAVTKLAATELVRDAGIDAVVLRPFTVVGPGAPLPTQLAGSLRGDDDLVVGGLELYRDFVDVRDVARAVARAVLSDRVLPPVVNLGSGRAAAVRELVGTLVDLACPGTRVVPGVTAPEAVPWLCADTTLAEQALDWRAEIGLRASLQEVVQEAHSDD